MIRSHLRFVLTLVLLAAIGMAPAAIAAKTKYVIEIGEITSLTEDEAILVLVLDTKGTVNDLELKRRGSMFTAYSASFPISGRRVYFLKVKPGTYYWKRAKAGLGSNWFFSFDKEEYDFEVVAGTINYPGDFIFHLQDNNTRARVRLLNRTSQVVKKLLEENASLYRDIGLRYHGDYPDDFSDFYSGLSDD